ncbi:hypothetical protein FQN49_002541 [Arthroderma sp. PD_2]|nr:hypothetical protein FQN49_002541 [Arthroderma sp. PD_2]
MAAFELEFGIEIEILLEPSADSFKDILSQLEASRPNIDKHRIFREGLASLLEDGGIPARADARKEFDEWTVVEETTIKEKEGYWRCELVSRVLSTTGDWQKEIDDVFTILENNCNIETSKGCSMHVHVSPKDDSWEKWQLKSLFKAALYFDKPMTRIMPKLRKDNEWAKSNVQKIPGGPSMVSSVPQQTWKPLFSRVDGCRMAQHIMIELCPDRYVSWNFRNLAGGGSGTVEFRRPPGVKTSLESRHWIAFTLAYVMHVLFQKDWEAVELTNSYPTTTDLRNAINGGTDLLGQASRNALFPAFMEDVTELAVLASPAERYTINQQKALKSTKRSIFVEKFESRPNTPSGF